MRHPRLIAMSIGVLGTLAGVAGLVAGADDGRAAGGGAANDLGSLRAGSEAAVSQAQATVPFRVIGGPAYSDLRFPKVADKPSASGSPDEIKASERRAAILSPGDAARFESPSAGVWKSASGGFSGEARYFSAARDEALLIMSWTPTGTVDIVLPLSSPVLNISQRTIGGLPAVLILQADGVQGRPGHSAYLASGDAFYYIETQGTGGSGANAEFAALVTRIAEGLSK